MRGHFRVFAEMRVGKYLYAAGTNNGKTHPLQKRFATRPDIIKRHAELDLLVKATQGGHLNLLRSATVHVYRKRKNDTIAMAKPCLGCQRALSQFEVKHVTYTDDKGEVQRLW